MADSTEFIRQLGQLMLRGSRPEGDKLTGVAWTDETLAKALRGTVRTLSNWRLSGRGPRKLFGLRCVLFGNAIPAHRLHEYQEFERAHRQAWGLEVAGAAETFASVSILPADSSSVREFILERRLLSEANEVGFCLYTSETILTFLREDLQDRPMWLKLLIRRPGTDEEVDAQLRASVRIISDMADGFGSVVISARFYEHDPFLRFFSFKLDEGKQLGLLGFYYHKAEGRRWRGAEGNELIICEDNGGFAKRMLDRAQSRMDLEWRVTSSRKAVIFDLDGLVIDSMPQYEHAWREALGQRGCAIDRIDVYLREGEKREVTARELYAKAKRVSPDSAMVEAIAADMDTIYRENFQLNINDGVERLVDGLKARGVSCGLVTGSSLATVEMLKSKHKLFRAFDGIVTGDDLPPDKGKPCPDPYLLAMRKLAVSADESVILENAPLGIRSAVAAGALCFAVLGSSPLPASMLQECGAVRVVRKVTELRRFLVWADANASMREVLKWLGPS